MSILVFFGSAARWNVTFDYVMLTPILFHIWISLECNKYSIKANIALWSKSFFFWSNQKADGCFGWVDVRTNTLDNFNECNYTVIRYPHCGFMAKIARSKHFFRWWLVFGSKISRGVAPVPKLVGPPILRVGLPSSTYRVFDKIPNWEYWIRASFQVVIRHVGHPFRKPLVCRLHLVDTTAGRSDHGKKNREGSTFFFASKEWNVIWVKSHTTLVATILYGNCPSYFPNFVKSQTNYREMT